MVTSGGHIWSMNNRESRTSQEQSPTSGNVSRDLNVRAGFVKLWQICLAGCAGEGFTDPLRGPDYWCYQHQRWGPCADLKTFTRMELVKCKTVLLGFFVSFLQLWFGISHSCSVNVLSERELLNLCCQNSFAIGWIILGFMVTAKMGKWCFFRCCRRWIPTAGKDGDSSRVWVNFLPVLATKKRKKKFFSLSLWPCDLFLMWSVSDYFNPVSSPSLPAFLS